MMGIIRKFLGPESKYDISLPYTYMAKLVPIQLLIRNKYSTITIES